MNDSKRLVTMMQGIPCGSVTRDEWLRIGMACKSCGVPCDVWAEWSRTDSARYHTGECERLWKGFNGGVGFGTAAEIARAYGAEIPPQDSAERGVPCIDTPSVPRIVYKPAEKDFSIERVEIKDHDLFGTLFHDGELIEIKRNNVQAQKPEIVTLEQARAATDISNFCPNPVDELGNITEYRYFVVESDTAPLAVQYAAVENFAPLFTAAVYSGGKSIHALVKVDAKSKNDYKQRAQIVRELYSQQGIEIDSAFINNPKQYARAAGYIRDGKRQSVVYSAAGNESGFNAYIKTLYSFETAERLAAENPRDWILQDYLCRGRVSLMIGQAKIGKTFLLFDMALSIATGGTWLNTFVSHEARTVFYLSYEMDLTDDVERLRDLAQGGREHGLKNVYIHPFGATDETAINEQTGNFEKVLTRAAACGADLVIVDTASWIYPADCDENSNKDISKLMKLMDQYARVYNVAILLVHHTAKQSEFSNIRDTIEKGAGAGAFGRFAFSYMVIEKGAKDDINAEFVAEHGQGARALQIATVGKSVKVHFIKANAVFMPTVIKVIESADTAPRVSNKGAQRHVVKACKEWRAYYDMYPNLHGDELRRAMNAAYTKAAGGQRKRLRPSDDWHDEMPRLFE